MTTVTKHSISFTIEGDEEVVLSYEKLIVDLIKNYGRLRHEYKLPTLDDWFVYPETFEQVVDENADAS